MTEPQDGSQKQPLLSKILKTLTGLPLWEIGSNIYQLGLKIWLSYHSRGIYEVLEYESTLELLDTKGVSACFKKREKVRYLQDNIIAYQDQAWGDGQILLNYHCKPGQAVDFYRPGYKTFIVISIQNVRNRGDQDEYFIEWGMKNCFLRDKELWETTVSHPTRSLKVNIVFPSERPPTHINLIEDTRHTATVLGNNLIHQLPDGHWRLHWETSQVKQHERYQIEWEW